jgi:molybdenum cofactor sulfurtransferase
VINLRQTGACRVSLGYGSTKEDCDRFILFLTSVFLNKIKINPLSQLLTSSTNNRHETNDSSLFSDSSQEPINKSNLYWHTSAQSFPLLKSIPPDSSIPAGTSMSLKEDEVILSSIFVYPIKSCSGVRVDYWPVTRNGLKYDRYFAIIDNSNNKVVTQKQYPMLALVQPSFHLDRFIEEETLTLHISSPVMDSTLIIPLELIISPPLSSSLSSLSIPSSSCEYNVCGRKVFGRKSSNNANEWFTEYLNKHHNVRENTTTDDATAAVGSSHQKHDKVKSFSLIQYFSSSEVSSSSSCNPSDQNPKNDKETSSFANTSQYLLLSTESIQRLIQLMMDSKQQQKKLRFNEEYAENGDNDHEDEQLYIKVENFRPNLVVSSSGKENSSPHQEDFWKSVTFPLHRLPLSLSPPFTSSLTLSVSGPCSRCSMVNVNGQSGVMSCKVFEALKEYRKVHNHVYFGQFLTFESIFTEASFEDGNEVVSSESEEVYYLLTGSIVKTRS